MTALFLAPHNDDEILFGSFTILRHRPDVVVCLRSFLQESLGGPVWQARERESRQALYDLNPQVRLDQLPVRDDAPDTDMLTSMLAEINARTRYDVVFAPAVEVGGHDHHNLVGERAIHVFGGDRVTPYVTYTNGGKTQTANEVPFEPDWPRVKLRAMSAYASQIAWEPTRRWFIDEPIREWYA